MSHGTALRLVDIAELIGVSKQRASVIARRNDFPRPVSIYGGQGRPLCARRDVVAWAKTYHGGAARWGPRALNS